MRSETLDSGMESESERLFADPRLTSDFSRHAPQSASQPNASTVALSARARLSLGARLSRAARAVEFGGHYITPYCITSHYSASRQSPGTRRTRRAGRDGRTHRHVAVLRSDERSGRLARLRGARRVGAGDEQRLSRYENGSVVTSGAHLFTTTM